MIITETMLKNAGWELQVRTNNFGSTINYWCMEEKCEGDPSILNAGICLRTPHGNGEYFYLEARNIKEMRRIFTEPCNTVEDLRKSLEIVRLEKYALKEGE